MISKKELSHRDKTIRNYLDNRDWDKNPEFLVVREVVKNLKTRKPELKHFKFVYDYEWEVEQGLTNKGKGDLVFTDGEGNFLIVECKKRNSKDVWKQALDYIKRFKIIHPEAKSVFGLVATPNNWTSINEEGSYWKFEIKENRKEFYQLFEELTDPQELELKNRYQKVYTAIGYALNDPMSALNKLDQKGIVKLEVKESRNTLPPYYYEIFAKLSDESLPRRDFHARASQQGTRGKYLLKTLAAARICEQIYLPFHLEGKGFSVKEIKEVAISLEIIVE